MTARLTASYYPADTSLSVWDMTTGDALRRAAERAGHLRALVEVSHESVSGVSKGSNADRHWTYSELLADAEACARWLLDRFEPGDHICLWAPNVPEWIIVQYGAALAGLVLVTANPSLRAEELQHVLEQSDSKAIIHSNAFRGTDMEQIASTAASAIDRIPIEDLASTLSQWRNSSTLPEVSPHAAAQMQFTSGTTGRPKGALLSHRALVTNAAFVAARMGQSGDTVVLMLAWRSPQDRPFTISSRVPRTLAFRASGGEEPQVSVDGGRNWGTLAELRVRGRPATSTDVTHVRWDVANPRAMRGRGVFTYSAVVR